MAKSSRPRKRMDKYLKNYSKNALVLSCNKKGSCRVRTKKWDVIRELAKHVAEDEAPTKLFNDTLTTSPEPVIQLLPRKDATLFGTIPVLEQRMFTRCSNCNLVFNPRQIMPHKTCSKYEVLIQAKKTVKSKNGPSKRPNSNSSNGNNSTVPNSNSTIVPSSKKSRMKTVVMPGKSPSMPQLKVAVTKILTKSLKTTSTVTLSGASSTITTTSSDRSDHIVSTPRKSSSGHHPHHHPVKSHISKSPSHHSARISGHHTPKSPTTPQKVSSSSHTTPRSSSSKSSSKSHHHHKSKSTTISDITSPSHHHHHHHTSSSSSSANKRSSSSTTECRSGSSKSLPKNYDPDTHCGVVDGTKGPCMRSITCSNHRLHLRKQVAGRSKDIHQLIAERKAAKENDTKHHSPTRSYAAPNGEAKDSSPLTAYVPAAVPPANTNIDWSSSYVRKSRNGIHVNRQIASVLTKKIDIDSTKAITNGYITRVKIENTQDNAIGTVPVVIMPVNPVSVISSVQLLKIGNNIISLESPQSASKTPLRKSMIVPIQSSHKNNIKLYKSHPKPVVLPNYSTRKLGGSILLTSPFINLLVDQRNDILATIERGLNGLNHTGSATTPDGTTNATVSAATTKCSDDGGTTRILNCKRPASDKMISSENKRLATEVNNCGTESELTQHELIIRLIDQHGC